MNTLPPKLSTVEHCQYKCYIEYCQYKYKCHTYQAFIVYCAQDDYLTNSFTVDVINDKVNKAVGFYDNRNYFSNELYCYNW